MKQNGIDNGLRMKPPPATFMKGSTNLSSTITGDGFLDSKGLLGERGTACSVAIAGYQVVVSLYR